MASDQSATPSAQAGGLTFEVDRFDWAAPDRIEVIGRWYGLRGHRFMRPVLDVSAGEDQRRLLALLEHKPWAAEEGEEWVAAFPWKGEPLDFDDAELALAPSIAVELEPPRAPGGKKRKPAPDAKRTHAAPSRPDGRTLDRLERELAAAQEDREQLRAEVSLLEGRLAAERDAAERREAHRASREERAAAEERDAAIAERDAARAERDEARRAALEARDRLKALRVGGHRRWRRARAGRARRAPARRGHRRPRPARRRARHDRRAGAPAGARARAGPARAPEGRDRGQEGREHPAQGRDGQGEGRPRRGHRPGRARGRAGRARVRPRPGDLGRGAAHAPGAADRDGAARRARQPARAAGLARARARGAGADRARAGAARAAERLALAGDGRDGALELARRERALEALGDAPVATDHERPRLGRQAPRADLRAGSPC